MTFRTSTENAPKGIVVSVLEVKAAVPSCTTSTCSPELILVLILVPQFLGVYQAWLFTELKPLISGDV